MISKYNQKLNFDIYNNILSSVILCSDDLSTYFSCIQVSRDFATITVPLLYKNPWNFIITKQDKTRWRKITEVIISSIPQEHYNLLFPKYCDIKLNKKRLFNYASYCKYLYHSSIEQMSVEVINNNEIDKCSI